MEIDKFMCVVCGWVFDALSADATPALDAGMCRTAPADDCVCPECGASDFEKIELE